MVVPIFRLSGLRLCRIDTRPDVYVGLYMCDDHSTNSSQNLSSTGHDKNYLELFMGSFFCSVVKDKTT